MFKMKNVFMAILSIVFVSCAPKMTVLLDGKPIPEYSYTLTNPETGIQVQVIAAKWSYIDEDGEKTLWPEYFKVGNCVEIDPKEAAFFEINIKVKNLKKAPYTISEQFLSRPLIGQGETRITNSGIYSGHLRYNSFKVHHVIKGNTYNSVEVLIENKNGLRLMKIGSFSYKVQPVNFQSKEGR